MTQQNETSLITKPTAEELESSLKTPIAQNQTSLINQQISEELESSLLSISSSTMEKNDSAFYYTPEDLISGLIYKRNQIMRFQNKKTTKIIFDFGDINEINEINKENKSKTFIEYFDFVIGIINEDKIIENHIEKDIYTGYIFLENYIIDNETEKILLQNNSLFDEKNKKRNLNNNENIDKTYFNFSIDEIKLYCHDDNGTLPIIKFDFYRNGKISKIFKPKNIDQLFYDQMISSLEKVIPKISKNIFNDNYSDISEAIKY
jgi:hypothetical protein